MAGAKIDYLPEVVAYRSGERTVMKTVSGPSMRVTYSLTDAGRATEIRVRNQGEGRLMLSLFGLRMGPMVKSRVDGSYGS